MSRATFKRPRQLAENPRPLVIRACERQIRRDGQLTSKHYPVDVPGRTKTVTSSSETSFDHQDYLGTVSRQTNSSQTTTGTRTYDAFGLLLASSGTPQGPFGFAGGWGYQEDTDSGLKLLGHRYYDASTGRFLTRDPAKDGRNWYGYCENGPTAAVDPDGHGYRNGPWPNPKGPYYPSGPHVDMDPEHVHGPGPHIDFPDSRTGENHRFPLPPGWDPKRNPETGKMEGLGDAAVGVGALWAVWEVGKWGVAVLSAPETGGLSLAGAAALP